MSENRLDKNIEYKIRNPKSDRELGQILNLFQLSFPNLNKSYYKKRILADPRYKRSNTFILIKDKCIVSHLHLFSKQVWFKGAKAKFAGLGAICSLPNFRNRGYASALIEKAIVLKDYQIMGLFTRIPSYYKRFQFSTIPRRRLVVKRGAWPDISIAGATIRRFNVKRDIISVSRIHKDYFRPLVGIVVRGPGDWQSQLSYFDEDKRLFLVLEIQGAIAAYIRCKWQKDSKERRIEIVEFASRDREAKFMAHFIFWLFSNLDIKEVAGYDIFFNSKIVSLGPVTKEKDSLMMWRSNKRCASLKAETDQIGFLEADGF